MQKNIILKIRNIVLLALLLTTVSCSGVSSDAKKAAKLTNKSIEKTNQLKLKDAEKLYNQSREIIEKYETHKKRDKFYQIYIEHRDKDRIKPLEGAES